MSDLASATCRPLPSGTHALGAPAVAVLLPQVPEWAVHEGTLRRVVHFRHYYETMAFVNAVAWIAHRQDHHPELLVGYNQCEVRFSTHSVGGLSENDFICAARVNTLLSSG